MLRHSFILVLPVIVSCSLNPFGPDVDFVNRHPMDPVPAVYETWYSEAEICLGASGDFASVRWFVADALSIDGIPKAGIFTTPHDITILSTVTDMRRIVKHEIVHHIFPNRGDSLHDERGRVPCD